jgi:hypothetical protein
LILQIDEIEPENRFLARFNIVRLAGKIGSGPSKRLSLRSIPKAVRPFFDMDTSGNLLYIWLLERLKTLNVGGRLANHSVGMVSEMLVKEI